MEEQAGYNIHTLPVCGVGVSMLIITHSVIDMLKSIYCLHHIMSCYERYESRHGMSINVILLPPFHIKLRVMLNFVKSIAQDGACFFSFTTNTSIWGNTYL